MANDLRVPVGFFTHPKTKKLQRRCGEASVINLMRLWEFCATNSSRASGDLTGMDDDDIEIAADWSGEYGVFVTAIRDVKFLDGHQMHEWAEHQPWVAGQEGRSDTAKKNALLRYHKQGHHEKNLKDGCPECEKRDTREGPVMPESTNCSEQSTVIRNPHCSISISNSNSKPTSISNSNSKSNSSSCAETQALKPPLPRQDHDLLRPESEKPNDTEKIQEVFSHYRTYHPRAHLKPHSKMKEWRLIKARLSEGSTIEDLKLAIDGCHKTPHNMGVNPQNRKYDKLELIMRDSSHVADYAENAAGQSVMVTEKTARTVTSGKQWMQRRNDARAG